MPIRYPPVTRQLIYSPSLDAIPEVPMFLSACLLTLLPAAGTSSVVSSIAPADGGKLLFVAMNSGRVAGEVKTGWVNVWDTTKPELKAVLPDLPADVRTIQPTADGKRFALIAGDGWRASGIEVWDTSEKKRLHNFKIEDKRGGHAAASPDGNWVAYRPYDAAKSLQVWNTETGKRAKELEKAAGDVAGWLTFSPDSKRTLLVSEAECTEFEIATGKKTGSWKRGEPPNRVYMEGTNGTSGAAIAGNKGVVSVSPTGKRRQSYIIRLATEKKEWFLGEVWDFASTPAVSADGRWIALRAGNLSDRGGIFLLKFDADGNPEMVEKGKENRPPFGGGDAKQAPAWRELPLGEAKRREERQPLGMIAFSPDSKRVFVGVGNELRVFDPLTLKQKAVVWASEPVKDKLPEWLINTPEGEFVGSPTAEKIYSKPGRDRDPTKVKEALGVK